MSDKTARITLSIAMGIISLCCMMALFTPYDLGIKPFMGHSVECLFALTAGIQKSSCDNAYRLWSAAGYTLSAAGYTLIAAISLMVSVTTYQYLDEIKEKSTQ